MASAEVLVLGQADILQLFDLERSMPVLRRGLIALAEGKVLSPPRQVHRLSDKPFQALGFMPGFSEKAVGAKLACVSAIHRGSDLDPHQGLVALFDSESGLLRCLADGATVTALRTAAVSAVASQVLARTDSRRLAIFGDGVQAMLHAVFLPRVFPALERVDIYVRDLIRGEKLAVALRSRLKMPVLVHSYSSKKTEADIICTVTSAVEVVVSDVVEDCHINAIGACTPEQAEIASMVIGKSQIFVESGVVANEAAGDLLKARQVGVTVQMTELGKILRDGYARVPGEITLFKSVGIGLMDVVLVEEFYQRVLENRQGVTIALGGGRLGIDDIR